MPLICDRQRWEGWTMCSMATDPAYPLTSAAIVMQYQTNPLGRCSFVASTSSCSHAGSGDWTSTGDGHQQDDGSPSSLFGHLVKWSLAVKDALIVDWVSPNSFLGAEKEAGWWRRGRMEGCADGSSVLHLAAPNRATLLHLLPLLLQAAGAASRSERGE